MDRQAEMGRRTPYEYLFHSDAEERSLLAVEEEARRAGLEISKRERLTSLASVAVLLERLVPEDAVAGALDQYLDLLHHTLNFRAAGCGVLAFAEDAVRSLVESPPALERWTGGTWRRAFYVELPLNLFWAAVNPGESPEPVEGMFVTRSGDDSNQVDVLLVLGMRPERPGFTVAGVRANLHVNEEDSPVTFDADLPGADLAGLYSLERVTQVESLLARLVWYVDTYPDAVGPKKRNGATGEEGQEAETTPVYFWVRKVERRRG